MCASQPTNHPAEVVRELSRHSRTIGWVSDDAGGPWGHLLARPGIVSHGATRSVCPGVRVNPQSFLYLLPIPHPYSTYA